MHADYLVDTNILIYHSNGNPKCTSFIESLIKSHSFFISVITKIEFLGWHEHQKSLLPLWNQLIAAANILPLDNRVTDSAINLRQKKKIHLGDAVIAATAIEHKLKLATRNIADFVNIQDLKVFDPAV